MQRRNISQYDLIPKLSDEVGALAPKPKQVIYTLEWVRIEEFIASLRLSHVSLIDHNPHGGLKDEFGPADAIHYRERTVAEPSNARLKDEFGGRNIVVKGAAKVMRHLMSGMLALSADQLM